MKIRLGLLDDDLRYTSHLTNYMNAYYPDKLEIFSFTSLESLKKHMNKTRIDILLASPKLVPEDFHTPKSTQLIYFSETQDVESIRGVRALCKYQKAELIYKEILNIYAELNTDASYKVHSEGCFVVSFMGASGGVGTTTAAAACAASLAGAGKKVLYLDLEENGVLEPFFSGEGTFTLSDALYAIKSNRSNLSLKLESMIRTDSSGVCFYQPFAVTLDARDMTDSNMSDFLAAVMNVGSFEYIVLDTDDVLSKKQSAILARSDITYFVCDGTEIANLKLKRTLQAVQLEDEHAERRMSSQIRLLYNRFGRTSAQLQLDHNVPVDAVIMKYEGGSPKQIMQQIVGQNIFSGLLDSARAGESL